VPKPLRGNLLEIVITTLIIGLLAIGTYSRNRVWSDEIRLWTDCIEKSPNKARPYVNLGLACLNSGDYGKAFEITQKAIQIDPKMQWLITTSASFTTNGKTLNRRSAWDKGLLNSIQSTP